MSGFALTAEIEMKLFSSWLKALAMAFERENNEDKNGRVPISLRAGEYFRNIPKGSWLHPCAPRYPPSLLTSRELLVVESITVLGLKPLYNVLAMGFLTGFGVFWGMF